MVPFLSTHHQKKNQSVEKSTNNDDGSDGNDDTSSSIVSMPTMLQKMPDLYVLQESSVLVRDSLATVVGRINSGVKTHKIRTIYNNIEGTTLLHVDQVVLQLLLWSIPQVPDYVAVELLHLKGEWEKFCRYTRLILSTVEGCDEAPDLESTKPAAGRGRAGILTVRKNGDNSGYEYRPFKDSLEDVTERLNNLKSCGSTPHPSLLYLKARLELRRLEGQNGTFRFVA